ncbi:MAG: aminofutalosine synthase MqnE [Bacteroidales bacterium]|nr:aminofutalosine synthase MqnE [Bacteroidales bacterium]
MTGLIEHIKSEVLRHVADKISNEERITPAEGLALYEKADLSLLAFLSGIVRRRKNGNHAYFNRNFHIEPTNRCIYNCRFCSYHKPDADPESWEYSHEEMLEMVRRFDDRDVTEVHIAGGVHPEHDLHYYGTLIRKIKQHRPGLHIKAFSAIELDYMIRKAGKTVEDGLRQLKEYGLDSIPGGGAEIFDEELRQKICNEKTSPELWLKIHETAHRLGMPSNATMLYGHLETYAHRIDHMDRLRRLQDKTRGFNAFIPLKYRRANNSMSWLGEVSMTEDLRNYAVARIYLDNFPHIKAYWPMTGKTVAQLSLAFGTDDLDGTINDTTRIYSMAGAEEKNPEMSTDEICSLIKDAGREPLERDSFYNVIKKW